MKVMHRAVEGEHTSENLAFKLSLRVMLRAGARRPVAVIAVIRVA
jgi:hypothetical protein